MFLRMYVKQGWLGKSSQKCYLARNKIQSVQFQLVNGLIDPDKFTNAVKETKNFPEPVLEKIKVATEKCKNHRHFSENKLD